ncbi:MAG TPA: 4-hydroxythreonine-4-phosphate dehydrogenase PdxA [Anaeromyxobacteraceae bacterium]|nr:4-hydroxythreonine-4-phosphate dehydrogenase PdxA [Anaeromyxobacteraceae bacterium]
MVRLAVSMGDPSGIGPEVTARALAGLRGLGAAFYVFGDAAVLGRAAEGAGLALPAIDPGEPLPPGGALVRVTRLPASARRPGRPAPAGGAAQLAYLEAAWAALRSGAADALCTAPVSKAQVQRALPGFVGHTEWLEARCRPHRSVMMLASARLRVALVTNHLALSRALREITEDRILRTIEVTHRGLRRDLGVARPRIAVCALNPHAGEQGAFGDEEARRVAPAVGRARRRRLDVSGPWPADSIFSRAAAGEFDAVVALYHDQGLIPAKLLDSVTGVPAVNVTLGLPVVRTSPDHGVAYDLAGTGRASDRSMGAAVRLAAEIARRRARAGAGGAAGAPPLS